MNVALPPELEAFVQEKVKGGEYTSINEVICEALCLLKDRNTVVGALYDGPLIQSIFEDFLRRREQEASKHKKDIL